MSPCRSNSRHRARAALVLVATFAAAPACGGKVAATLPLLDGPRDAAPAFEASVVDAWIAPDAGVDAPAVVVDAPDVIAFVPSSVVAFRTPGTCGVPAPPFGAGDIFALLALGATDSAPYDGLELTFSLPMAVGVPMVLSVQPYLPQGDGILQPDGSTAWYAAQDATLGSTTFEYRQGWNPSEIDTGAFDAASVTFLALPAADGEALTAHVQVHFDDGRIVDQTFSANITTYASGCPNVGHAPSSPNGGEARARSLRAWDGLRALRP